MNDWAAVVSFGPSADGVFGPIAIASEASAGMFAVGRKANQRPSSAFALTMRALSSASTSSAVASRTATSRPSAVRCTVASTAAGSMRWSKVATNNWSSARLSPWGENDCTVTGGVRNVNVTSAARAPPLADSVPLGTVTV